MARRWRSRDSDHERCKCYRLFFSVNHGSASLSVPQSGGVHDGPQLLHDCRLLRVVWCDRGATRRALSQAVVITSAGDAARRLSQWLRFLWTVPALKKQARGEFRSSLGAGSRRRQYCTCPYITGGVPVLSCIVCGLVTRVLHASRTSTITARLRADLHKAPWSKGDGSLAESNTLPRAIESCRCPSLSN